jgi:hypothetical protein
MESVFCDVQGGETAMVGPAVGRFRCSKRVLEYSEKWEWC